MSRKAKISGVALCLLASMGVLAALAQTADKEPTELYVRTSPAGATITVDGKQQGISPKLFEVEPGDHTVVVKLAGHEPKTKKVTVRDGRIKRVVLKLQSEPDMCVFGTVFERVIKDHTEGRDYLIDLDTGKLYTRPAELTLIEEMHAWARKQGIDASGVRAGEGVLTGFEIRAAIVDESSWEEVTPQAAREALKQPDPRVVVRYQDASTLICLGGEGVSPEKVYAFKTREGGVGVVQLVGRGDEDHPSVKIRYKLVSGTAASPPADQVWTCATHPQVNVPQPGRCPICAMDLVAKLPESAVREVIASFVEAAARNDTALAATFLSKRSRHVVEHTREIMSAGMEVAKIRRVVVADGRALAATDFAQVPDAQQKSAMSVVYALVKEGDRWVVDNIDLADADGLSEEISDLQATADPPASSRPAEDSWEQAEMFRRQATVTCRELETALEMYRLDMGTYPTTEAGLAALVEKPKDADPRGRWTGPYVSELPTDPWGLPYRYRRVTVSDGTKTTIWSLGPDKCDGTNDDIRVGIDYDIPDEGNTTTETPEQPTENSGLAPEISPFQEKSPVQVEEQKVRDLIAKFAVAAVKGDKPAVAECLHPKMRGLLDELDELAEAVSDGLKLDEIQSVFVRGDRALVATEMAPFARQKCSTLACTVYALVKVGGRWVIEDIEMEDENELAEKIGRFQGKSPMEIEEQKVRDVIAKFAQALEQRDKAAVRAHLHPNMWDLLEHLDLTREMIAEGMKTDEIRSLSVDGDRASVATEMFVIGDIQMPPACTVYRLVKVYGSWLIEAIDLEDEKGQAAKTPLLMYPVSNTKETPDEADRPAAIPAESVERILRNYSEAVWAGALPLLDSAEPKKVQEMIQQVAATAALRHIMPHRDMVVKHVLDRLPDAEPIDPSQWTEKSTSLSRADLSSLPLKSQALWHPVVVVSIWRDPVIIRAMGSETFGKYAWLRAFAPCATTVLDRNIERPVIATAFGDELVAVHLRRGADGSYRPEKLEWLKRKPTATQDYFILPPDASEAQRLIHAFSKEAWATLLPRLDTLEMNDLEEAIAALARRHFAEKHDVFVAEGERRLAELPDGEPFDDRDQWQDRFPSVDDKRSIGKMWPDMADEFLRKGYLPLASDPVRVARSLRLSQLVALTDPTTMGVRSMVATAAVQPLDETLDRDPERPVIITRTGDEAVIVRLRRTAAGAYVLDDIEWLVRKKTDSKSSKASPSPNGKAAAAGLQGARGDTAPSPLYIWNWDTPDDKPLTVYVFEDRVFHDPAPLLERLAGLYRQKPFSKIDVRLGPTKWAESEGRNAASDFEAELRRECPARLSIGEPLSELPLVMDDGLYSVTVPSYRDDQPSVLDLDHGTLNQTHPPLGANATDPKTVCVWQNLGLDAYFDKSADMLLFPNLASVLMPAPDEWDRAEISPRPLMQKIASLAQSARDVDEAPSRPAVGLFPDQQNIGWVLTDFGSLLLVKVEKETNRLDDSTALKVTWRRVRQD